MDSERSPDELVETIAGALGRRRVHSLMEAAFGSTLEYKILTSLIGAGRPLCLTELARMNGFERSAIVSYSKGSKKYEGEMRAVLERLVARGVVAPGESFGKTRYRVDVSTLDGLLAVEFLSPRPARYE